MSEPSVDISKVIPMSGKMLCEVLSDHTVSKGGIFLARTKKETLHCAKVIKAGDPAIRTCKNCDRLGCDSNELEKKWRWYDHENICSLRGNPMELCAKTGDIVHFKKNYGYLLEGKYLFLTNQDIIAVEKGC